MSVKEEKRKEATKENESEKEEGEIDDDEEEAEIEMKNKGVVREKRKVHFDMPILKEENEKGTTLDRERYCSLNKRPKYPEEIYRKSEIGDKNISPGLSHPDLSPVAWKGSIILGNLIRLEACAQPLTDGCGDVTCYLPNMMVVSGRIDTTQFWDELKTLKKTDSSKAYDVVRFVSSSVKEHRKLYKYFHHRRRVGVIHECKTPIRCVYILPLPGRNRLPSRLGKLKGVPQPHPNLLLGVIMKIKVEQVSKDNIEIEGLSSLENLVPHLEEDVDERFPLSKPTLTEDNVLLGQSTLSEDVFPLSKSTLLEDGFPLAKSTLLDDGLPLAKSTLLDDGLPFAKSTLSEEVFPSSKSTLLEDGLPLAKSTLLDNGLPLAKSTLLDNGLPSAKSTLTEEVFPLSKSTLLEDGLPLAKSTLLDDGLPLVKSTLLDDGLPFAKSTLSEEVFPLSKSTLPEDSFPLTESTQSEGSFPLANSTLPGDISPSAKSTLMEVSSPLVKSMLSEDTFSSSKSKISEDDLPLPRLRLSDLNSSLTKSTLNNVKDYRATTFDPLSKHKISSSEVNKAGLDEHGSCLVADQTQDIRTEDIHVTSQQSIVPLEMRPMNTLISNPTTSRPNGVYNAVTEGEKTGKPDRIACIKRIVFLKYMNQRLKNPLLEEEKAQLAYLWVNREKYMNFITDSEIPIPSPNLKPRHLQIEMKRKTIRKPTLDIPSLHWSDDDAGDGEVVGDRVGGDHVSSGIRHNNIDNDDVGADVEEKDISGDDSTEKTRNDDLRQININECGINDGIGDDGVGEKVVSDDELSDKTDIDGVQGSERESGAPFDTTANGEILHNVVVYEENMGEVFSQQQECDKYAYDLLEDLIFPTEKEARLESDTSFT